MGLDNSYRAVRQNRRMIEKVSGKGLVMPFDRTPFQTKDRDVFRIGIGVDVFKLFKKDETPK